MQDAVNTGRNAPHEHDPGLPASSRKQAIRGLVLDYHGHTLALVGRSVRGLSVSDDDRLDARCSGISGLTAAALTYDPALHGLDFWSYAEPVVAESVRGWKVKYTATV